MTMFPTPFFGRSGVYRGAVNYLAFSYAVQNIGGGVFSVSQDFRVSADGLTYKRKGIGGDIGNYSRSDRGGAFSANGAIKFGNLIFLYGTIWDDGNNSRCGLFVSKDGLKTINRLPTDIDGPLLASGGRGFVDAAVFGSSVVFLSSTGELAWTSDGVTVSTRANLGFAGTGVQLANTLAAGTGFLIAGGVSGQAFSVATPDGAATARNLQFGASTIEKIRAGNVLTAVGSGKIATTALNAPAGWAARNDPVGGLFDYLDYVSGRWFAAGYDNKWITSPDGAAWSVPNANPMGNVVKRVRSAINEGNRLLVFLNSGIVAATTDFINWNLDAASGLAALDYRALKVA